MNTPARPIQDVMVAGPRLTSLGRPTLFELLTSCRVTSAALLVWWLASLYPLWDRGLEDNLRSAADATTTGSLGNQLLVLSFALLGAVHLPQAIPALRARRESRILFGVLGVYLLWSAATILWSDDIALSIRRLGILILVLIGAIGLGTGFYAQSHERTLRIARHVQWAAWTAVATLVASRLWNSNLLDLLDPDWMLKSDTRIEFYVFPVSYGLVAALVLYPFGKMKQTLTVLMFGLVLILLKGRTMLAGAVAASLLVSARLSRHLLWRGISFALGLLLALLQVDLAAGGRIFRWFVDLVADGFPSLVHYLTIGHGIDDLVNLSGRVPLWQTLWPYFWDNPLAGHGFGAFWNASRFEAIDPEAGWLAVAAHNGFLDELLATGIIGLVLILIFWFVCIRVSLRLATEDERGSSLVFGWLVLFLLFNSMSSLLQCPFLSPNLFSLTALFALLGPSWEIAS
jgi:O-antigen ligase